MLRAERCGDEIAGGIERGDHDIRIVPDTGIRWIPHETGDGQPLLVAMMAQGNQLDGRVVSLNDLGRLGRRGSIRTAPEGGGEHDSDDRAGTSQGHPPPRELRIRLRVGAMLEQ